MDDNKQCRDGRACAPLVPQTLIQRGGPVIHTQRRALERAAVLPPGQGDLCDDCIVIKYEIAGTNFEALAALRRAEELIAIMFRAVDSADTAFAVLNLDDNVNPQGRSCIKQSWALVQEARVAFAPNSTYAIAVQEEPQSALRLERARREAEHQEAKSL